MYSDESDSLNGQSSPPLLSLGVSLAGVPALREQLEKEGYFKSTPNGILILRGTWKVMYGLHFESPGAENLGEHGAASHESH